MAEPQSRCGSAARPIGRCRVDRGHEAFSLRSVETMIRHASPSGAITTVPLRVHGATARSCLIAPPSPSLPLARGLLCADARAVNLTSIASATDENLNAAASAQKKPAGCAIDGTGFALPFAAIFARILTAIHTPYHPHLSRDVPTRIADHSRFDGRSLMKTFAAALIAAVILYAVDSRYNDGRYTQVLQQAVTSLMHG